MHSQGLGPPEVTQGEFLHGVAVGVGQKGIGHRGQAGGLRVVTVCLAPRVGRALGAQDTWCHLSIQCPVPGVLPQPHPSQPDTKGARPEARKVKSCLLSICRGSLELSTTWDTRAAPSPAPACKECTVLLERQGEPSGGGRGAATGDGQQGGPTAWQPREWSNPFPSSVSGRPCLCLSLSHLPHL